MRAWNHSDPGDIPSAWDEIDAMEARETIEDLERRLRYALASADHWEREAMRLMHGIETLETRINELREANEDMRNAIHRSEDEPNIVKHIRDALEHREWLRGESHE